MNVGRLQALPSWRFWWLETHSSHTVIECYYEGFRIYFLPWNFESFFKIRLKKSGKKTLYARFDDLAVKRYMRWRECPCSICRPSCRKCRPRNRRSNCNFGKFPSTRASFHAIFKLTICHWYRTTVKVSTKNSTKQYEQSTLKKVRL